MSDKRAMAIGAKIKFRAACDDLGIILSGIATDGIWGKWGYSFFTDYYRKELHMKESTVKRLIVTHLYKQKGKANA